jgi:Mg2+ and Co2+ transporter CorA
MLYTSPSAKQIERPILNYRQHALVREIGRIKREAMYMLESLPKTYIENLY